MNKRKMEDILKLNSIKIKKNNSSEDNDCSEVKLYKINVCGPFGDFAHGGYDINEIYIPKYDITLNKDGSTINVFKRNRTKNGKDFKIVKLENKLIEEINEIALLNEKIEELKNKINGQIKFALES